MDFEVVVYLKMLFLHLIADTEENSESTYQDRTHCRLTPYSSRAPVECKVLLQLHVYLECQDFIWVCMKLCLRIGDI